MITHTPIRLVVGAANRQLDNSPQSEPQDKPPRRVSPAPIRLRGSAEVGSCHPSARLRLPLACLLWHSPIRDTFSSALTPLAPLYFLPGQDTLAISPCALRRVARAASSLRKAGRSDIIPGDYVRESDAQPAPQITLAQSRLCAALERPTAFLTAGTQVTSLALPLLILAITHSAAQAGIVAACSSLPRFLFALPAGALVDGWDRKRVMIVCDSVQVVAMASIPIALAFNHLSMIQLYLVAFSQGTCFVFFWLARLAALPRVVPKEQLSAAVAERGR